MPTRVVSLPVGYEMAHNSVVAELKLQRQCCLCGETYAGADIGTLACRFHPFDTYYSALRMVPYSSTMVEHQTGDCDICSHNFLAPAVRAASVHRDPIDEPDGKRSVVDGCTRIDHCESFVAFLDNAVIGIPSFYAEMLTLRHRDAHLRGEYLDSSQGNVLLVSRPEQMALTLHYDMPGAPERMRKPVLAIYERMAGIFELQRLSEALRLAKKGAVANSITRIKQLRHPDAERKFGLYASETAVAEFVPFYIIVRFEQLGKPIELK